MKLAEALQIRADLQRKIRELEPRLSNNATVQEGEKPSENPQDLLNQLDRWTVELEEWIVRINLTNARMEKDGKTMTALLAKRDALKLQISVYRNFLYEASQLSNRARGTEIKIQSTVSVAELQKKVDKKSAELRNLELKIQEMNWLSELEEE